MWELIATIKYTIGLGDPFGTVLGGAFAVPMSQIQDMCNELFAVAWGATASLVTCVLLLARTGLVVEAHSVGQPIQKRHEEFLVEVDKEGSRGVVARLTGVHEGITG